MTLSPDDIERRSFTPSADGYHQGEVRSFLERVAAEHRAIIISAPEGQAELGRLTKSIAEQEQRLSSLERRLGAMLDRLEQLTGDLGETTEQSSQQLAASRKITSDQKNLIAQMAGQVSRVRSASESIEALAAAPVVVEPVAAAPTAAEPTTPAAPNASKASDASDEAAEKPPAPAAATEVGEASVAAAVETETQSAPARVEADTAPETPKIVLPETTVEQSPEVTDGAPSTNDQTGDSSTYSYVSPSAANTFTTTDLDPPVVPAFGGDPIPHRTLPSDTPTPARTAPALPVPPMPENAPMPTAPPAVPPPPPVPPTPPTPIASGERRTTDTPLTTVEIDEERRRRGPAPVYDDLDKTPHITEAANSLLDGVLDDVFGNNPESNQ